MYDICHIYNLRHAATSLYKVLYKISKIHAKYEIFKGGKNLTNYEPGSFWCY